MNKMLMTSLCYSMCVEGVNMTDNLEKIQTIFPEIDVMYQEYAKKNGYPGYAYGVVLDGQLVHTGSGGFIDIDKKIPATSQSMFRIASMTKSFTAMAILKLRDEGKLRLDDPIELYIPEMRAQKLTQDSASITIRDLLTHSAGFPTDDPWADRKLEESEEDLIALLNGKITFSNPSGTVFEYSNLGYTILGYLINKITGVPYQEYINTTICKPLGMESYWEYSDISKSQLVHGYSVKDKQEEALLHDGIYGAMGGLITSIESFSKYIACHQSAWPPRDDSEVCPIKRSSMREMHQPWKFIKLEEGPKVSSYGYGLKWIKDSLGRVFVGHSGGLPGFGSNWFFLPEYGLGIVSFANSTYADTWIINLEILNKLLTDAQLSSRQLPPSEALRESQKKLIALLPNWENITTGIFAANVFLDRSLDSIKKESKELFLKAGKMISIGEVIPKNQSSGYFLIKCEKIDLQIKFSLTPENPPLIQHFEVTEIKK